MMLSYIPNWEEEDIHRKEYINTTSSREGKKFILLIYISIGATEWVTKEWTSPRRTEDGACFERLDNSM
jgi:hypothetical protein